MEEHSLRQMYPYKGCTRAFMNTFILGLLPIHVFVAFYEKVLFNWKQLTS